MSASGAMPAPARILVAGAGAREHALAWRLAGEPATERVLVAPGNPAMRDVADVRPAVAAGDADALLALVRAEAIELVVVGPEALLVAGLADRLTAAGVAVFGPSAAAARLEGSKAFAREVAEAAGVRMAEGAVFDAVGPALAWAAHHGGRVVVKADGLAAGKGVTVCATLPEAEAALRAALEEGAFGPAGERVVVERALAGREASLIAICDGNGTALALPAARDHKRLGDGDRGPNTGGMGAYSPVEELTDAAIGELIAQVHRPVLAELARRGLPFRGALYAGLMLTAGGPRLLEFNVRLGDPEAQALLPRVGVPLGPLLLAAARDRLATTAAALGARGGLVPTGPAAAVALVLAAAGYPGTPRAGDPISGLAQARAAGGLVFAAGVAERPDGTLATAGGRVLTVVGRGATVAAAADAAYAAAGHVAFAGRQNRRDIGRGATVAAAREAVA